MEAVMMESDVEECIVNGRRAASSRTTWLRYGELGSHYSHNVASLPRLCILHGNVNTRATRHAFTP